MVIEAAGGQPEHNDTFVVRYELSIYASAAGIFRLFNVLFVH